MKIYFDKKIKLWQIIIPLLVLANVAYGFDNFIGWVLTLGFFLYVPGNLLIRRIWQEKKPFWETTSLSVGLSVALVMITGLALNSATYFGLERPMATIPSFVALDTMSLLLLSLVASQKVNITLKKPQFTLEEAIFASLFGLLPFLAIGGAIRLNNGASNILTMILMALIGALFVAMTFRKGLSRLYPFALIMAALSILFCNSLRGWFVTGHDIHHEFLVLLQTLARGYWVARNGNGDPYNACLSITILPAVLAKITTIAPIWIYKVVFQVMFALLMPVLYSFCTKFASKKLAMIGVFAFMTFPTFTNDLPFLNRQEIAFMFFILLMYVNLSSIGVRAKTLLSALFFISIIMAHYSSSYASIGILFLALIAYRVLVRKNIHKSNFNIPILHLPILIVAILATFAWNTQITVSSSNLSSTLVKTVRSMVGGDSDSVNFAQYNILLRNSGSKAPAREFDQYIAAQNGTAQFLPPPQIPLTSLGKLLSKIVDVQSFNTLVHAVIAKILQLLVLIGAVILFFRYRRKTTELSDVYFLSIVVGCFIALAGFTLFPQLSVGYDITRLFQQSMIVLWLPFIIAAGAIFKFLGRFQLPATTVLIAILYFNLAGFAPQLTGGFLPQLALNNSGLYYDYFYTHDNDVIAAKWLAANRDQSRTVHVDTGSSLPPLHYSPSLDLFTSTLRGYIYLDNTNTQRGVYRTFVTNGFAEYTNSAATDNTNLIYNSDYTEIYTRR